MPGSVAMTQEKQGVVRFAITSMTDVIVARREGRELALALGFRLADATRIAVIISELARNILLYANTGTIIVSRYGEGRVGIRVIAEDEGPGIEDIDRVLAGGYSTSRGLGVGLSGSRNLADEFSIHSQVGKGTTVVAVKWRR
jgi:serine/threonine-protein kinase RsbT